MEPLRMRSRVPYRPGMDRRFLLTSPGQSPHRSSRGRSRWAEC